MSKTTFENWIMRTLRKSDSELIKAYKYHNNRNEAEGYTKVIIAELRRRGIPKKRYTRKSYII